MRSKFLANTRKWIGASALAILVGLGGGTAFLAASAPVAVAQVTPAAQVTVPAANPALGFADLVEAVKPAVVAITIEGREMPTSRRGDRYNPGIPDLPDDFPFRDFFNQFGGPPNADRGDGSQRPQGRKFMAAGSGFAISADGYVVTNNHVVRNAEKVTVVLDNGEEHTATVVGTDEKTDLAVVKVEGVTDMPFVTLASDAPRVGDWVVAVGNPFGFAGSVTAGIVSAVGRDVQGSAYGDFLQIDAAINSGNSGGPTFNLKGEVVGVNAEIYTPNGGNVGLAFAIPAHTVKQVTQQLIEKGVVTRGGLGVQIQSVTKDIADSVGLDAARGALVTQVNPGSAAEKAGLKSGDIILEVDGTKIDDNVALARTIGAQAPGATVELLIWRDQAETTVSATLGTLDDSQGTQPDQPQQPDQPAAPESTSVGLTLVPNADGEGVLIQEIDPASAAAEKGFNVGDAILEVDNKPVASAADFEAAVKAVKDSGRNTALIKAARDGVIRFVGLPLGQS